MTYPKVSIIILNWNRLEDTINCLDSLKKITYSNYEVIVVDNGSKGNDANVLDKKYGDYIRLIRNKENLGFAEGNNIAIRKIIKEGKSEYILCLNNDTKVEPNFLNELIECAKKYPQIGSVQAKMILAKFPKYLDSVGLELSKTTFGFNRGAYEKAKLYQEDEEILGCCAGACLYKRKALEDITINGEIFDKDFFVSFEDFDVALRLQWIGWKAWYCSKAIVYHQRGATTGVRSKFIIYYNSRNQIWNFVKNIPFEFILRNLHFILIAHLGHIGINLLKGKFYILPSLLKGKFDGLRGIRKILKKRKKIKKRVNFSEIEKRLILKWRIRESFYSQFQKTL